MTCSNVSNFRRLIDFSQFSHAAKWSDVMSQMSQVSQRLIVLSQLNHVSQCLLDLSHVSQWINDFTKIPYVFN